jgi:predicted dehydrogenase
MAHPLRAGVVGAGVFGGFHAAKWSSFEGAVLTAVIDADPARARALAAAHGAQAHASEVAFFEAVDLVSVCSPAATHAHWALAGLKAGKPVYVEKPLATDPKDADAIVAQADRRGLVAACGFLERFVPRAVGLFGAPERPLLVEATRLGLPSPRNLDVSVVLDLMIHDLDLALALCAGEPFAVEAEGACVVNDLPDEVRAEVSFDDGLSARFEASRVAAAPRRALRLVYPSGEVELDLLAGTLRNTTGFALNADWAQAPEVQDRLAASLRAFLAAVRDGRGAPVASARDGARALDLALAVQLALGE